ncbi:MAG: tail completion protein gp17 [Qipengyuania sp.]
METRFRHDLVEWLRADSVLASLVNAVEEESPAEASPPWIGIAASAASDWSSKDRVGREVRVALEFVDRSGDPSTTAEIVARIEMRIATMPPLQPGYRLVMTQFLRSRAERRKRALRAALLEYRFLLLADA